jgi:hypothetical protein
MADVADNSVRVSAADDTMLVLAVRRAGELHTLAERSNPARATISGGLADAE